MLGVALPQHTLHCVASHSISTPSVRTQCLHLVSIPSVYTWCLYLVFTPGVHTQYLHLVSQLFSCCCDKNNNLRRESNLREKGLLWLTVLGDSFHQGGEHNSSWGGVSAAKSRKLFGHVASAVLAPN